MKQPPASKVGFSVDRLQDGQMARQLGCRDRGREFSPDRSEIAVAPQKLPRPFAPGEIARVIVTLGSLPIRNPRAFVVFLHGAAPKKWRGRVRSFYIVFSSPSSCCRSRLRLHGQPVPTQPDP